MGASAGDYRLVTARLPCQVEVDAVNVRPGVWFPDLLVSLPDLARSLAPSMDLQQVCQVLTGLSIDLYSPNTGQGKVLEKHGKSKEMEPVPLVLVRDVVRHVWRPSWRLAWGRG